MQKAVIFDMCCTIMRFWAEQSIQSAWSVRPVLFWEWATLCKLWNVDEITITIIIPNIFGTVQLN
jgi:hypothetical protein